MYNSFTFSLTNSFTSYMMAYIRFTYMLGEFVQQLRKKHDLTQEYLASKIGVSRPTYVQIEQGERDITITEARKLAEVFDIPFESFICGDDETTVPITIARSKKNPKAVPPEEIRISVPQENAEKFRQILLYILKKVGGKPNVGMTVLYKLLYFIDFDYYEKFEEQLMGLQYVKNQHGPTPPLFATVLEKMKADGDIEIIKSKYYQYPQTKYLVNPATEPDLSVLNGREQEHIDWELQRLSDLTAAQLSDLSHRDVPWITAENKSPLNYESVFYRTADTSVRVYEQDDED